MLSSLGVGSSQVSCSQFSHEDLLVMWPYLFQKRPNMRQNIQKKLFLARISQFDTRVCRKTTSPKTGPTIQNFQKKLFWDLCWQGSFSLTPDRQQVLLLGPPFNATANLSSLVHVQVLEPFSLYKKPVTSICCLSPRPGAQRSLGRIVSFSN